MRAGGWNMLNETLDLIIIRWWVRWLRCVAWMLESYRYISKFQRMIQCLWIYAIAKANNEKKVKRKYIIYETSISSAQLSIGPTQMITSNQNCFDFIYFLYFIWTWHTGAEIVILRIHTICNLYIVACINRRQTEPATQPNSKKKV